jgi:sulfonate transport system permease protein
MLRDLIQPFARPNPRVALVLRLAEVALVLTAWQVYRGGLVPGPGRVLQRFVELWGTEYFIDNFLTSLSLTVKGMGMSVVIALLIAYGSTLPLLKPVAQLIVKFRYLTTSGLIFVFLLMTHGGASLKLTIIVFGIVPFFVNSLLNIMAEIPRAETDLCRTLRMGPWRTLLETVVVGRADYVFEVVRSNFAIAWMMITMVEGVCMSEGGLGTLMIKSNKYIDLATVFAVLLSILLFGVGCDVLLGNGRRWIFPYSRT